MFESAAEPVLPRRLTGVIFPALILLAGVGLAAESMPISDSMSLNEIDVALRAYPPAWDNGPTRHAIFASMDKQVTVRLNRRAGLSDEDRRNLGPLRDFYRKRVDQGLDRLERTVVADGVQAFKFYSSSYVFRSAEGTVAVDFCQGPISTSRGEPEDEDELRCGFYWTPQQRRRLAAQVDVMLITHRHHDHCDFSLARRLLEQGKTVIGPRQVQEQWKTLLPGITVPDFRHAQTFGPVRVLAMQGCQFSTNRLDGDGVRRAYANSENPGSDSETVVYLFDIGGLAFLQAGENHVPYVDFLKQAEDEQMAPHVVLSQGQFQGASSVADLLSGRFRLSVHEYEMTHEEGGNRMAYRLAGPLLGQVRNRQRMILFWGEDFHLTADLLK